jgi:hypothetical protein
MRSSAKINCLVVILLSLVSAPLMAQVRTASNPPQGGKFFDGLYKELRNSYLLNNSPLEQVPAASAQRTQNPELVKSLQGFANSAAKLVNALRFEERYSPNIRVLLADAIDVQARAYSLAQNADRYPNAESLANEFAQLDRNWRLLAYQIQQTRNIGSNVTNQVDNLNRWNQQLERLTQTEPQIQREDLSRHLVILWSELQHMADEMRFELYRHPKQNELTSATRDLANRARQLQVAAERGYPHSEIERYYNEFYSQWMPIKRQLRMVDSRQIESFINRIATENDRLHELLLLDPVIDGRDILYMAETLKQNVDVACDTISLRRLIAVPNSVNIYRQMQDFYVQCNDFKQTVSTETNLENVRWDFRELDVSWNDLKTALAPVAQPDTQQKVSFVDKYVSELRSALGLQPSVSHDQAVQLAASVDNMSDLLAYDVRRYVGQSGNYPSQFRDSLTNLASTFRNSARTVYETIGARGSETAIRQRVQELAYNWHQLESQLAKVRAEDRAALVGTVQYLVPTVTKLQVMYGY